MPQRLQKENLNFSQYKMKFLIDENVHKGLYYYLINRGYDVKLSPKSARNGNLFSLMVIEERILITRDSDFLNMSRTIH